jgi:hypothetical protein
MLERIPQWFGAPDWDTLFERLSNDNIISFFTQPIGMTLLGALMLASVLFKKRILFVVISAALAVSFLTRYTLAGHQGGPNKTMFLFAGGVIAIGAFVIYFLFIRDE